MKATRKRTIGALGKRLRREIETNGCTVTQAAAESGLSYPLLLQLLNGTKQTVELDSMRKLAKWFSTTIDELDRETRK